MSDPTPLIPGGDEGIKTQVINDNFSRLQDRFRTNVIKDAETGNTAMIIGKLPNGQYGISFSDGTTVFMTMTKDGIILNDGTDDRVLIGKDVGGF